MSLKKAPAKTFDDIIRECEAEENLRDLPHFVSLKDFLSMELPPREFVVEPILPTQGLMMIYAKRGVGKTFFALHIACSIARQTNLFNDKWKIDQARKVLYIDGEMPANTMQERLKVLNHSHKIEHDNLIIINNDLRKDDLQRSPAPNLATEEGQNKIEALIDEQRVEVIVIDNLSTLCRGGKENESDSWLPIQEWILRLRSKNKSVILVHHAGKNNEQRGTSRREDILDTVIKLKHPDDYKSNQGARFEAHFEKSRGFAGEDADPFDITLEIKNNEAFWYVAKVESSELKKVVELSKEGMTQRAIAAELKISAAKVNRLLSKAKESEN